MSDQDPIKRRDGGHPADIADRLQQMETDEATAALRALPREQAAGALAEMDTETAGAIAAGMSPAEAGELLAQMPHEDAADIAAELPSDTRREILSRLPPEDSADLRKLMQYAPDTAGGIMSDEFIALPLDATIGDCRDLLHRRGEEDATRASYLYVVDRDERLAGVITIRDLVFRKPERPVAEIVNRKVATVGVDDDQETVARLFTQYHFLSLPVLDRGGRLVGVVRADQVIDVIQSEATEDMQRMVGVSGEEHAYTPWNLAISKRLPWLLVNLATAFLAAAVVGFFEGTIARWTTLAIFLPIVAGQGGNAGMQTLTVIIRAMALGEIQGPSARRALLKETVLGLLNGLAIGVVVGIVGYAWKGDLYLGVIASIAMFLNMFAAALCGVLIPYALRALRIDPALASSIFLTTVTDVAGFFFFLGLAALFIAWQA